MSHCTYLIQLPSSYYFRIRVPPNLQSIVGKKEIRYSLRCGSLAKAKPKARLLAGKIQQLFTYKDIMSLSQEHIQSIISEYVQDTLGKDSKERILSEPFTHDVMNDDNAGIDFVIAEFKAELGRSNHVATVGKRVQKILEDKDISIDTDSDDFKLLCWEFLKADIGVLETILARNQGNVSHEQLVHVPEPRKTSETLGKVIEAYIAENIRAKAWKERTIPEYKSNLKFIEDYLGASTAMHKVGNEELREFKNLLMQMPKYFRSKKEYRGMSLQEIADLDTPVERIAITTINDKYLGMLIALFNFAERNGYIKHNPAKDFKIKTTKKKKASEQQDIFQPEDLKMLFNSIDYQEDKHDKPFKFWLPILGLYTGCRIEELCQLYCEDVKQVDNVWVLDINENHADQSVKTSERRLIPLHPDVLDMSFIEFVQKQQGNGHERIFHELKRQGNKYGHYPSRWFGEYKKRCGIEASPRKKTFHSFRHTLTDNLGQQLINSTVIKAITGHAEQCQTLGRYRKSLKPEVVLEKGIMKLRYEGLDLSHLKKSKYVRR